MIHDVKVNADECIGCGKCESTCSRVFRLTYRVQAEVKGQDFNKDKSRLLAAYSACPVQAIELSSDDPALQTVWHEARILSETALSETVVEIKLQTPLKTFRPGQYVTVRFKDDVGYFNRAYSIVDLKEGVLTLCITLLKSGRGSSFFANYEVGGEVEITDAKGDFQLQESACPKLFVGTGAGLAPLVAMMEACPNASKTLFFGQRKEQNLFYLDRLNQIPNLDVHICLSGADENWDGLRGRVTDFIKDHSMESHAEVYACGNDAMLLDLSKILKRRKHPATQFYKESFTHSNGAAPDESGLRWRGWIRNVHVYTSLLLAVLFLFFGFTGYLANRADGFDDAVEQTIPSNVALEKGELVGYLKGVFEGDYELAHFDREDGFTQVELANSNQDEVHVEIDEEDRSYVSSTFRSLPPGSELLAHTALAERLAETLPGHLDEYSLESDDELLSFNMDSVWSKTAVMVDLSAKRYEVQEEPIPWVMALILLHKGKVAAPFQQVMIDFIAWGMVIATLSGVMLVLQSRSPSVRIVAWSLLGVSTLIFLALVFNR